MCDRVKVRASELTSSHYCRFITFTIIVCHSIQVVANVLVCQLYIPHASDSFIYFIYGPYSHLCFFGKGMPQL